MTIGFVCSDILMDVTFIGTVRCSEPHPTQSQYRPPTLMPHPSEMVFVIVMVRIVYYCVRIVYYYRDGEDDAWEELPAPNPQPLLFPSGFN